MKKSLIILLIALISPFFGLVSLDKRVYPGKDYNVKRIKLNQEALFDDARFGLPEKRIKAIQMCGLSKILYCFKVLSETLFDKTSKRIREESATGLGVMRLKLALPYLYEAMSKEKDLKVKMAIIWGIGVIGDPKSVQKIKPFLKNENWKIRRTAARSLRLLESKEAIQYLTEALKGEDENKVNLTAAHKETFKTEFGQKQLIKSFHDRVKLEIYHALLVINSQDYNNIGNLIALLESSDMWVRYTVGKAIIDLELPEAFVALQKALLVEDEPIVREVLFKALNKARLSNRYK